MAAAILALLVLAPMSAASAEKEKAKTKAPASAPAAVAPATLTLDEIRTQLDSGSLAVAVEQLELLAHGGNHEAELLLGDLHMAGRGVVHNYSMAATWYRRAADGGNADAEFKLGVLHQRGQGTILYLGRARELFTEAARQGHAGAIEALKRMGVEPPPVTPPTPAKAAAKTAMAAATGKDAKAPGKDAAKAVAAGIAKAMPQFEKQLAGLKTQVGGGEAVLSVDLLGAGPLSSGAPDKQLASLLQRLADAQGTGDVKALKTLMEPEYAACAKDGDRAAYDAYLKDVLDFAVKPDDRVSVGEIKPDAPLPFAGGVTYPVRPSHYLAITGAAKAAAKSGQVTLPDLTLQLVVKRDGGWSLVFGCPAATPKPAAAPKAAPKPAPPAGDKAKA